MKPNSSITLDPGLSLDVNLFTYPVMSDQILQIPIIQLSSTRAKSRDLKTAFWEVPINRDPETGSLAAEVTLAGQLF